MGLPCRYALPLLVTVAVGPLSAVGGQQSSVAPGTYWKRPVSEAPGASRRPSFSARIQTRYSWTQNAPDQPTWLVRDDTDAHDAYNTRRIRLSFQHQFGDDWLAYAQVRRDWGANEFEFNDLYVTYGGCDLADVTVGQMRVPFDRQFLFSDPRLPLAERPRPSVLLVPDRDIGILLHNAKCHDRLGWYAGLFAGNGKNELTSEGSIMPAARVEWLPTPDLNIGVNWARRNGHQESNFQKFLKKNGDAYGLQPLYQAEKVNEEHWGVDVLYRRSTTSIWAGYAMNDISGPPGGNLEGDGWYVYCGQYVPVDGRKDRLELVAGYEAIDPNQDVTDQLDAQWFTIGFNYHLDKHRRQFRVEYVVRDEKRDDVPNNTFLIEYDHTF